VVAPVVTFEQAVEGLEGALVLANRDGAPWGDVTPKLPERGSLAVAIGPEGGFTDAEVARATEAGARIASLGPHTLRTETAAVVAVALARA